MKWLKKLKKLGVDLPSDMLEAAKSTGISRLILSRYLDMEGSAWPLGFLMRHCSILRIKCLLIRHFCLKSEQRGSEKGKGFWAEFELYAADLLVGIVVDIALVGMLAPYVRIGKQTVLISSFGRFRHACGALPSRRI